MTDDDTSANNEVTYWNWLKHEWQKLRWRRQHADVVGRLDGLNDLLT